MKNYHNNISSVSMHIEVVDMYIFFAWSWQMLFDSYDNHEASKSFIFLKDKIGHCARSSVLRIVDFIFDFLKITILP